MIDFYSIKHSSERRKVESTSSFSRLSHNDTTLCTVFKMDLQLLPECSVNFEHLKEYNKL